MNGAPPHASARPLAWGYAALTAATAALIVLGALVRANGAGLACPDWPLCFGQLVPTFDMRVGFEWGHRLVAGLISLGLVVLTVPVLRDRGLRRALGRPLLAAWLLLMCQIVLGGLTVLLSLAPWTVTAHLLVGTSFAVALLWIATDLFSLGAAPAALEPVSRGVAVWVVVVVAGVALQLPLGGMVSSHSAGLACSTFPTCNGESLVPTLYGPVGLHVLHRLGGFAILVAFAALTYAARRTRPIGRLAVGALHLVIFQIGLGVLNVLLRLPVEITALHSALACALTLVTALIARDALAQRASVPVSGAAEAA